MTDWLSSTWEASWRSFQYFNLYRLVLAVLFCLALLFPNEWTARLNLLPTGPILTLTGFYLSASLGGLLLATHWQQHFNKQLSVQVMIDIAVVTVLMLQARGVGSGLGILLLVSLAAASLVGRGRLVLFYAAVATLSVLLMQSYGILAEQFEPATIVQAGLISAGFFATAILARLLGQRVMVNEDLARRRGIALENQILISQRVVERVQLGVAIVDRHGAVIRCNPMAQEMLGLPAADAPSPLAAYSRTLAGALAAWQGGGEGGRLDFSGAGGRDLQARFESTSSSDGEVLIFLEDLGRIKERAQQLKLASLGRLTASIAHEIRNPLSSIGHAGELLREERRGEMQERLLRILNDNVRRLDRIVRDVLELGRQQRAEPEMLGGEAFCVDFLTELAESESIPEGVVVLDARDDVMVCFDRSHLHQVLWNLVSNAVRHSTGGPGAVRVVLQNGPARGRVEFHVIDDGPGIPASVREQIFEPFFTTHTQGTGLGLFIARELCATNGGSLELMPSDRGAHFILVGRNDTCQLANPNDAPAAS